MYKDERDIFYYDAVSRVWNRKYTQGLRPFAHYELAKAIKEAFDNEVAEFTQTRSRQATYVTAIRVFPDRCEMLIGFTDPGAADPTLNDRPARKRRVVEKEGDEGIEHSAHVIWYYKDKTNNQPCAFYLEGAFGLSSTAIVRFLNRILRGYVALKKDEFTVPDPEGALDKNGNYKRIPTRPRIELHGHPSNEFIKDLRKGELSEVELYTEAKQSTPWDANAYAVEERRSVLIRPNLKKHVPKAKSILDGILSAKVKNDYELARVVFKTEGNVSRSVRMYSQNYQLVNDDAYVRKERIKELGGNLPNAFDKIHLEIMRRMRLIAGIK